MLKKLIFVYYFVKTIISYVNNEYKIINLHVYYTPKVSLAGTIYFPCSCWAANHKPRKLLPAMLTEPVFASAVMPISADHSTYLKLRVYKVDRNEVFNKMGPGTRTSSGPLS